VSERRPRLHFAFFLHAHLPWVIGHGRWPHGVEWLLEASIATYLPLVRAAKRLHDRGQRGGLTLSLSPILAEQLAHPTFIEEMREYLEERIRTSGEEARRFEERGETKLAFLARWWREIYESSHVLFFEDLKANLPGAFRDLAEAGTIELATCGATHGYFPLLARDESIALQVRLARHSHETRFGKAPSGMWIPEAAYRPAGWWKSPVDRSTLLRPGVEEFLAREDIRYFLVDASLLAGGKIVGTYHDRMKRGAKAAAARRRALAGTAVDSRASYLAANSEGESSGVSFFVRDPATALQVWSKDRGYPGDPEYLEFHKKSDGGGHRYWRVTGSGVDLGEKDVYDPSNAQARVRAHADHFANLVRDSMRDAADGAILAAPFDAELFGHWWFEGIDWLEQVLQHLHEEPPVRPISLREHEERFPSQEVVKLPEGSWGEGGQHHVWLNPEVEWTWKKIHPAEEEVWSLIGRVQRSANEDARRMAVAALRQLLLLCASDWQFLMTTDSASEYAAERVHEHAANVQRLAALARRALAGKEIFEEDWGFLEEVEARDNPFPELSSLVNLGGPPRAFAASDSPAAKSSPPEESSDRFPPARTASPEESEDLRPSNPRKLRRSESR
jgi:1,4-alpha-glucan branching enzyme